MIKNLSKELNSTFYWWHWNS